MSHAIERTIAKAFTDNTIASMKFLLISGNYFTNIEGIYIPAEIAMVRFSFNDGIVNRFHTYVNPENIPLGYRYDVEYHSAKTHRLPTPPNSKGERDHQYILSEMKGFMGEPIPILFTSNENIAMIKSFIRTFVDARNGNGDIQDYRVHSLEELFYEIKETAVRNGGVRDTKLFKSIVIAEEYLRCDDFGSVACAHHSNQQDVAKYCALAHVQNWAYILMDNLCNDLKVELISGRHIPIKADIAGICIRTPDTLSFLPAAQSLRKVEKVRSRRIKNKGIEYLVKFSGSEVVEWVAETELVVLYDAVELIGNYESRLQRQRNAMLNTPMASKER